MDIIKYHIKPVFKNEYRGTYRESKYYNISAPR